MQQSQNNTVGFKYLLEKRKKLLSGQRQKSMQTPPQKKTPKKIRSMVEAICRTKLWRAGGGVGGKTEKRTRRRKNKKGLLRLDLMIKSTVANGSKIRGK
jgi:hypothetical protein